MTSSFFDNLSQWIIGIQPDSDDDAIEEIKSNHQTVEDDLKSKNSPNIIDSTNDEILNLNSIKLEHKIVTDNIENKGDDDFKILDDAAIAAINIAKNIGGSIFNIGKKASEQLYNSAIQLKNIVENTPVIGDFNVEQETFLNDIEKRRSVSELSNLAVEPPWFGYNEEAIMKTLILGICQDQKNFLNEDLPSDEVFNFNYDLNYPTALYMLKEDPMLEFMRFKLVPKHLSERLFWKNYFYKIFCIKQSVQLSTLKKITELDDLKETNEKSVDDDKSSSTIITENISESDQLANWEKELIDEMANDPMLMSDTVKIPEDIEKELLMELQQHLETSQVIA